MTFNVVSRFDLDLEGRPEMSEMGFPVLEDVLPEQINFVLG